MAATDRRKRLFENIVRLRRAERDAPASRDIVAVRTALEEELGETVSRRLAASLLGVSHTALSRWIKAGDLPVVYNAKGRDQLPVAALLDLYEAVNRERGGGRRRRHVLEPTMSRGRARARSMNTKDLVSEGATNANTSSGHRRADLRSLAYHRALAPRLRRPMVDDALHRVWKWRDQGKVDERYAQQWEEILRRPVVEVRRIISEDSSFARDLRQNSPFAGMLSEAERRKIVEEIR
jgi:hypothetical protein